MRNISKYVLVYHKLHVTYIYVQYLKHFPKYANKLKRNLFFLIVHLKAIFGGK